MNKYVHIYLFWAKNGSKIKQVPTRLLPFPGWEKYDKNFFLLENFEEFSWFLVVLSSCTMIFEDWVIYNSWFSDFPRLPQNGLSDLSADLEG